MPKKVRVSLAAITPVEQRHKAEHQVEKCPRLDFSAVAELHLSSWLTSHLSPLACSAAGVRTCCGRTANVIPTANWDAAPGDASHGLQCARGGAGDDWTGIGGSQSLTLLQAAQGPGYETGCDSQEANMKRGKVKNRKWTSHQRSGSWSLGLMSQSSGCSEGSGRRLGCK